MFALLEYIKRRRIAPACRAKIFIWLRIAIKVKKV